MVAFREVFRRSGVDEGRSPPGMVVPLGGENIVALIDPGRKLKFEPAHALEIKEIDAAQIRTRVMQARDTFSEPDIDPQLRAASLPAIFNGDARRSSGRRHFPPSSMAMHGFSKSRAGVRSVFPGSL